jgi:hypothetical protein
MAPARKNWKTEFEYVQFRDEVWEIHDVKTLLNHVFKRLWETSRTDVLKYSAAHPGLIVETPETGSRYDSLDGSHYLFMGLFPQYMLSNTQRVLDDLNMAE